MFSDMTFARSNNKDLDHVGTHVLTNLNAMKTDGLSLTKCYMFLASQLNTCSHDAPPPLAHFPRQARFGGGTHLE